MSIKFLETPSDLVEQIITPDELEDDAEDPLTDRYFGKSHALLQIPPSAKKVASFEAEINHSPGLTWQVDLTLFIVAVPTIEDAFALLCLDWDDNWGRWEWRCEGAVIGAASEGEAKEALLGVYRASMMEFAQDEFIEFLESL